MDIGPADEPLSVEQARDYLKDLIMFFDGKEDIRLLALAHEIVSHIQCHCAPLDRAQPAHVITADFRRNQP